MIWGLRFPLGYVVNSTILLLLVAILLSIEVIPLSLLVYFLLSFFSNFKLNKSEKNTDLKTLPILKGQLYNK